MQGHCPPCYSLRAPCSYTKVTTGYIKVILGLKRLYCGYTAVILGLLGLYRENGKEHGNYKDYRVYIGII